MKKLLLLLFVSTISQLSSAQDTFSICAYDSVTGELGSAGATCIMASTSAYIISDVVPGKGVVHTQAAWIQANKTYAHSLMVLGLPPQQIIDSMIAHDAQGDPTIRQYGVVDIHGNSAGYTGVNCMNYKNHLTGPGYSIQGNILLGQQILDSMESRFLNTTGTLACRLMAAMQGAKVVGADTRCDTLGISSVSAFLRIAEREDTVGPFLINITLNTYPNYSEPIDSLQERFDLIGGCNLVRVKNQEPNPVVLTYPNPVKNQFLVSAAPMIIEHIRVLNAVGALQTVRSTKQIPETEILVDLQGLTPGVYFVQLFSPENKMVTAKVVKF